MDSRLEPGHAGIAGALVALAVVATGCQDPGPSDDEKRDKVLSTYADIVHATYEDSRDASENLAMAVDTFTASPSEGAWNPLKLAFHQTHNPFVEGEAFRFYGGPIDDVWGHLNAWRMDPSYIDYTQAGATGIINNPDDYPTIDKDTLLALNQADYYRDVATGFHAVEFLIWGEDLNADKSGGKRPATDYSTEPSADRRKAYLKTCAALIVDDLTDLTEVWEDGGSYRSDFLAAGNQTGIARILTGLSTLTEVELAQRLLDRGYEWEPGSDAPPDELAPFSDRTIEDLGQIVGSMENVYLGRYERVDGTMVEGDGLSKLVADADPDLDDQVKAKLEEIQTEIKLIPEPFETAVFLSPESRETVDDVRDALRELDELWVQVGMLLQVEVEQGESEDTDTGDETGDTGTDDGGTVFLPSSDMG
jgi:putative iron-regulated protein